MVICPKCQSEHCIKNGFTRERQRYKCEKCDHQWLGEIEKQTDWKLLDGTPITQVQVANFLLGLPMIGFFGLFPLFVARKLRAPTPL